MKILGIDYGDARIGLAMSDAFGWTAQGYKTIHWNYYIEEVINEIISIIDEYKVEKIVVGLPKNMNGTLGVRVEKTKTFIALIKEKKDIEIIEWDERLTTIIAKKQMREMGIKTKNKKKIIDQIAAINILQGYLDYCSNSENNDRI